MNRLEVLLFTCWHVGDYSTAPRQGLQLRVRAQAKGAEASLPIRDQLALQTLLQLDCGNQPLFLRECLMRRATTLKILD